MVLFSPLWSWPQKRFLFPYQQKKTEKALSALTLWAEDLLGGTCVVEKLKRGHGKARKVMRISNGEQSAVIHWAEHRRIGRAFFHIGQHLYDKGLSVPRIKHYDLGRGFFMVEDLGKTSLQHRNVTKGLLAAASSALAVFHNEAWKGFDSSWCAGPPYTRKTILSHCLRHFRHWAQHGSLRPAPPLVRAVEKEFHSFLEAIEIEKSHYCLGHPDYHIGNIFWARKRIYIIDWDFVCTSPAAFDLAKLFVFPTKRRDTRQFRKEGLNAYLKASSMPEEARELFQEQVLLFEACWLVRLLRNYASGTPHNPHKHHIARNIRQVFSSSPFTPYPALVQMMLSVAEIV